MKENKRFHLLENLVKNMPNLIEAFVSFYGEEKREEITRKFNNVILVAYYKLDTYKKILNEEKDKIISNILETFKEETKITDDRKLKALFGINPNLKDIPLLEELNKDLSKDYYQRSFLEFLKDYSNEDLTSLDDPRVNTIVEELKGLVPAVIKVRDKYQEIFNEELKQYEDYYNKLEVLKLEIETKHAKELLTEISDLLSDKDKELIKEEPIDLYKLDCNYSIIGNPLTPLTEGYIESFSKENEELLNNQEARDYRKDSVKFYRIFYFKSFGINCGENYEDYINDERCKKLIPSFDTVERIIETKEKYRILSTIEFIESMPHHKPIIDEVANEEFLINPELAKKINNLETAICPNYVKRNGQFVEKPFLFIDSSHFEENIDCNIIHELNHLLECFTINVDENGYELSCGWDIVEERKQEPDLSNFYDKDRPKRNYEILNEVINEFISQDICKILHENGITFSTDINKAKNIGGTIEDLSLRKFVRGFYEEFKTEIIASRHGDISKLIDVIGKNNFEEYNEMLKEYYNRFNEGDLYRLSDALHDNIDNEDTRFHKACMAKTIELLERFREHRDNVRRAK